MVSGKGQYRIWYLVGAIVSYIGYGIWLGAIVSYIGYGTICLGAIRYGIWLGAIVSDIGCGIWLGQ